MKRSFADDGYCAGCGRVFDGLEGLVAHLGYTSNGCALARVTAAATPVGCTREENAAPAPRPRWRRLQPFSRGLRVPT